MHVECRQISYGEIAQRGIQDRFRLDNRKQYQHDPEKHGHPAGKVLLPGCASPDDEKRPDRQKRRRETAEQQDDKMEIKRPAMPRIARTEKPDLIFYEFGNEPGPVPQGFQAVP